MYFIIERERLPEDRHYELMPDGRAIVSGNEAKMMDILEGVTVVQTTAQLEELRRRLQPKEQADEQSEEQSEEQIEEQEEK